MGVCTKMMTCLHEKSCKTLQNVRLEPRNTVWKVEACKDKRACPEKSGCNEIAAVDSKRVYESINKLIMGFVIVVSHKVD